MKAVLRLTGSEKNKYALLDVRDSGILAKIRCLEKKSLSKEDKHLVALIRTQLEKDWRKPLVKELERLGRKYSRV